MKKKIFSNFLKTILVSAAILFGGLFANSTLTAAPANALPEDYYTNSEAYGSSNTPTDVSTATACKGEAGSLSWIICPLTNTLTSAVDTFYGLIQDQLEINPINMDSDGAIHRVWQAMRDITNIVFIIFLIVVLYSQITGVGISNYGIKRALPRLIIAIIAINLSFIVCAALVDISNIAGGGITALLNNIANTAFTNSSIAFNSISWKEVTAAALSGSGIAALGIGAAGGIGAAFWTLLLMLIGAVISVAVGLITIALRQGVVAVLVMVAPLAIVAYMLPNTEKWFTRWRQIFVSMLTFYPMFAFLFGACKLIGWALILSASSVFMVIIGLAVTVLPLFLAVSLLKMSGTVLGQVYNGLNRLTAPLRGGTEKALQERAQMAKMSSQARNVAPSAKLRNYLAYREGLREKTLADNTEIVKSRALTRVMNTASSTRGFDKDGNRIITARPNRYMQRAKQAGLESTRARVAAANYKNTLNEFGDHFHDRTSKALSNQHASAFVGEMIESYREVNNAQADQDFLLDQFLTAGNGMGAGGAANSAEYNRLIKGSAGSLRHKGESAVLGQVITKNAQIETRRRGEASIIMKKFGVDKPTSRAFLFDAEYINDDGRETDENGRELEDKHYRLKKGEVHREWKQYIAVHKDTGEEIESVEYLKLSKEAQSEYTKVRYFDIVDDSGKPVQRVYSDDAGYMKELIGNDIMIGDPINRRYTQSMGLADTDAPVKNGDTNKTGLLRKYHSTIASALLASGYKEHAAEISPMITAQADHGYITSDSQFMIAGMDSLTKAAKAGAFLQNDAYAIDTWTEIFDLAQGKEVDGRKFEDLFTDEDVLNYRNVNGLHLHGMELVTDENGNQKWQKVDRADLEKRGYTDEQKADLKRNFIRQKMVPDLAKKLFGMMNRNPSASILDAQKPATAEALLRLVNSLADLDTQSTDNSLAYENRINPDTNIFDSKSPNEVRIAAAKASEAAEMRRNGFSAHREQHTNDQENAARSTFDDVRSFISEYCENPQFTLETATETIREYIDQLDISEGMRAQAQQIIDTIIDSDIDPTNLIDNISANGYSPRTEEEARQQLAGGPSEERVKLGLIEEQLIDLLGSQL